MAHIPRKPEDPILHVSSTSANVLPSGALRVTPRRREVGGYGSDETAGDVSKVPGSFSRRPPSNGSAPPDASPAVPGGGSSVPLPENSRELLQAIGGRFVELSIEKGTPDAWRELRSAIMKNLHILCPFAISLKDAVSMVADIDDRIKGQHRQPGRTSEESLRDFLQTGNLMTPEVVAPLDNLPPVVTTLPQEGSL